MSGKSTMKNFKAMLAEAQLPEKTVDVCLRGDLFAEHQAAEAELEQAEKAAELSNSLDGGAPVAELVERIEAIEATMREHTYPFRIRGLASAKFRALKAEHPPRKDDDGAVVQSDRFVGANIDTFFDALARRCTLDPELTEADWRELADEKLTESQLDEIGSVAFRLSVGEVSVPFSQAASRLSRSSSPE
ncbi:MAG: hypothetical protein QOH97_1309 [Actinoplanes sp.]|jgi:hypothetical protein|nr:hypothetical protein [Actinoplanes sp.]